MEHRHGFGTSFNSLLKVLPVSQISFREADRVERSHDESSFPRVKPVAVVWPQTVDEIQRVVAWAAGRRVPITPRGAGSSLEGNSIPSRGAIVVDLMRMNRVLEVCAEDFLVRTEPGVVYAELNRHIKDTGLFFPPSPGGSSDSATIGGMVATNASGIYSVRYGGTRDYVKALTLIDGRGRLLKLGRLSPKQSSGLDLVNLIVGSEGILGIVAEITLRLAPRPEASKKMAFSFADDHQAARAIVTLKQSVSEIAAIEFLDAGSIAAVNRFKGFNASIAPSLFLELQGAASATENAARSAAEACVQEGGSPVDIAGTDPWEFRHFVTRAIRAAHPDCFIVRNDVGFPVSSLPDMIARCRELEKQHTLKLYAFGHAGLGILHVLVPAKESDRIQLDRARQANEEIIRFALERGGTISGEHGIGLGHRKLMKLEHGANLDLMRAIKKIFDPKGILNPGKVLP